MNTTYSTCYACPLRRVGGKQCAKLKAMSSAIHGLGIKKIDFHCEERDALFPPGQRVWYKFKAYREDGVKITVCGQAWVWKRIGNKIRVCRADGGDMSPIIKLFPNQLERMDGGERRVCLRCGKPEGVADMLRNRGEEPREYICATAWQQMSDTYGEDEPVDCVFAGPDGRETTYDTECRLQREEHAKRGDA